MKDITGMTTAEILIELDNEIESGCDYELLEMAKAHIQKLDDINKELMHRERLYESKLAMVRRHYMEATEV